MCCDITTHPPSPTAASNALIYRSAITPTAAAPMPTAPPARWAATAAAAWELCTTGDVTDLDAADAADAVEPVDVPAWTEDATEEIEEAADEAAEPVPTIAVVDDTPGAHEAAEGSVTPIEPQSALANA